MIDTFGDKLVADIRAYLKDNGLTRLGQLNAPLIKMIADRRFEHEARHAKAAKAKARMTSQEQSLLFDALAEACGCKPKEMPKSQARTCGVALAEIVAVMPDVTPEEFGARALRYRKIYREAALTPRALSTHWGECGLPDGKPHHPRRDPTGAEQSLAEPAGWRDAMKDDDEDGSVTGPAFKWASLPTFYQQRIAKKMKRLETAAHA